MDALGTHAREFACSRSGCPDSALSLPVLVLQFHLPAGYVEHVDALWDQMEQELEVCDDGQCLQANGGGASASLLAVDGPTNNIGGHADVLLTFRDASGQKI